MNRLISLSGGVLFLLPAFASAAEPARATDPNGFQFHDPRPTVYHIESTNLPAPGTDWIKARRDGDATGFVEFGSRVVLQLQPGVAASGLLKTSPLTLARTVTQNVFIFQARDALTAMREAQRLGQMRGVEVSHPVQRRLQIRKHGPYAARPNDTYFYDQWNLENRNTGGGLIGPDLNVRAAWPFTLGEGVVLAIADDGVELTHPEFAIHATNGLHFNFVAETTNAMPEDPDDIHATAVAGLALAQANNRRGMAGVAPAARLASWKIFQGAVLKSTDEQLLDMFQFRSNLVSVQNHSWGNAGREQLAPTTLESIGISNAITFGRNGRGIIMVRSAGNGRNNPDQSDDANDDGYANDPRVICVASIRRDRRTASYSSRGACLLTAAPGGDWDRSILTTDRQGSEGYNTATYTNDFADYVSLPDISGTSFAAPQVSGLTALILGANPNLTYRDVQQILLLSSRHFDLNDPDLRTNRAGLLVSHNLGFGVPDAGWAVALARSWVNRPEVVTLAVSATDQRSIPEDGLRVVLSGANVPATLSSIPASPSVGPHTDTPTPLLPLVDVGSASSPITTNLTGKGALIQRDGVIPYSDKIQRAAVAGAAFAIISNHLDEDPPRRVMLGTEYVSIPAVMIDQSSGAALRDYLQLNPNAPARIQLEAAAYHLSITNTLLCEHVGVRVQISHERRGDLRITLLSPGGTRSVLQRLNLDTSPGPSEWTYYSTHHFYESSAGIWTISISDEEPLNTGSVQSVELIIRGVSIADVDADGLDDDWETAHFGSLASGPQDDSDGDGYNNLREQVMGTDPKAVDVAFAVHFSPWDAKLARLSWPGVSNRMFEVLAATNALAPLMPIMNLPGRFPETEWFTPYTNQAQLFFRVRAESP